MQSVAEAWLVYRLTGSPALLGVTAFVALLSETGAISMPSALAGIVGMPCAFLAAGIVTHLTPAPAANLLELAMELRVPGGETLYDREVRLQRMKNRAPS